MAFAMKRRSAGATDAGTPDPPRGTRGSDAAERRRAAHGGIRWGAAILGWLAANALAGILIALASAARRAAGLDQFPSAAEAAQAVARAARTADAFGAISGLVPIVVVGLGYCAGGYVASRMARLQGARQGVAVWLVGLAATVVLALAGGVPGSQPIALSWLTLPRAPMTSGPVTTAELVALAVVLAVALAGAVLGGLAGQRYPRALDRAGGGR